MPSLEITLLLIRDNFAVFIFDVKSFPLCVMLCSSVALLVNGSHDSERFGLSELYEVGRSGSGWAVGWLRDWSRVHD